jgi:hypothetical protein
MKMEHKFFWIKGKPGADKSVLIKYLDQHVTRRLKKSNAIGLYFYFNARGGQLEKSFLGLYRSLLVQLVHVVPELVHKLDALDMPFDLPQLQGVLTSAITGLDRQVWIFIDALDECREGDVQELIDFLDELQEAKLYVCFASRHYPLVKVRTNLQLVLEDLDEHKQDLSTYVEKLVLEGESWRRCRATLLLRRTASSFGWCWSLTYSRRMSSEPGSTPCNQDSARYQKACQNCSRQSYFEMMSTRRNLCFCLRWLLYA